MGSSVTLLQTNFRRSGGKFIKLMIGFCKTESLFQIRCKTNELLSQPVRPIKYDSFIKLSVSDKVQKEGVTISPGSAISGPLEMDFIWTTFLLLEPPLLLSLSDLSMRLRSFPGEREIDTFTKGRESEIDTFTKDRDKVRYY